MPLETYPAIGEQLEGQKKEQEFAGLGGAEIIQYIDPRETGVLRCSAFQYFHIKHLKCIS